MRSSWGAGIVLPGKEESQGHLIIIYNYLKNRCRKMGSVPSHRQPATEKKGHGLKLHQGRLRLDTRRDFFQQKGLLNIGMGCPGRWGSVSSMEVFKKWLDTALGAMVWLTRWRSSKGWTKWSWRSFPREMILWYCEEQQCTHVVMHTLCSWNQSPATQGSVYSTHYQSKPPEAIWTMQHHKVWTQHSK